MPKIEPAAEAVTVLSQRLRIITPILPDQRVQMRGKHGGTFEPEYIFTEITVYHDGLVQIEGVYAYGEVNDHTLRTDYTYAWNADKHAGWEDKPPTLLIEHVQSIKTRDWSKE